MRGLAMMFLALGLMAASAPTFAEQNSLSPVISKGISPMIPKGKGDQCVADTDLMRREHMNLLKHQRDETTRRGIRTRQFSLRECVACHAVPGPDARPVSARDPRHFCRACHDYVAVKIDCFECHASRPPDNVTRIKWK